MINPQGEYLPAPAVQARYAVSDVTLWRWCRDPKLRFPKAFLVNRRRFFKRAELEMWEHSMMGRLSHAADAS
jgi:hypothetical protein